MKTKEELNALKEEVETVSRKLTELTDEELEQVNGGTSDMVLDFIRKLIAKYPDIDEDQIRDIEEKWKNRYQKSDI